MGPDEDKWCTQIKDNGQTPDGFHYGYKAQAEFMAKFLDDEMNGKNKEKSEDTSTKKSSSAKEEKKGATKEEKKSGKKVEKSINGKKESDSESKKKKVIKSVNRDNRF